MNILIVDDREENRCLLEALLKGNGHDVEEAANGAEALEKLKSGKFELIISDILMPVMDGFQLCRKVKTDEALRHIPFIVYTATYTDPQDEVFAMKIGADRFIQKPCEPEAFMEAIRDVMAAAECRDTASTPAPVHDEEMLKLYNERLVRKLEQKMLELEREVQARREVDETLGASERKYRLLADNVHDVIFDLDMDLNYTYVSPSVKILRGYEPEEVLKQTYFEVLTPSSLDLAVRTISEVLELEKSEHTKIPISRTLQLEMLRKDGTTVWTEVKFSFIRDEDQRPVAILGVTRDITERKRIEDALRESEKKYRELYDFLPIPVYEMDFETNITSANRAIYETFRGTEEDLKKGLKAWQLISPEEIEKSSTNIQKLLKGEQVKETEYTLMRL